MTPLDACIAYNVAHIEATKAALRSDPDMRGYQSIGPEDIDVAIARGVVRSLVTARAKAGDSPECRRLVDAVPIKAADLPKILPQAVISTTKRYREAGDRAIAESCLFDRTPALDDRAGILAIISASREPVPELMEFRTGQK